MQPPLHGAGTAAPKATTTAGESCNHHPVLHFFATTVYFFAGTSTIFCYCRRFGFPRTSARFCIFATIGILVCWNELHYLLPRAFFICCNIVQFCYFCYHRFCSSDSCVATELRPRAAGDFFAATVLRLLRPTTKFATSEDEQYLRPASAPTSGSNERADERLRRAHR